MKCLRCGYCCTHYFVAIVDNPKLGIVDENIITHEGNGPCKHLIGNKPGEYSCAIHEYPWYKDTPCHAYTQVEESIDNECRTGAFMMKKENKELFMPIHEFKDI